MNVFIVFAHPESQSFNAALKDLSVQVLADAGHQVEVSDLYAMDFEPVASARDFGQRAREDYLVYALEQRHGYQTQTLAPDILVEIEKIKRADLIVLHFPIFWFSLPAILKGWIDRVFISGYTYGGMRFYDRGGLAGKKAMITATLGGRPHMFGPDAVHGELETMLRHLLRGTLYYVGLSVLPPFFAYHVPYIRAEARARYLERYRDHLLAVDQMTPLSFPSLDEFDDRLCPRRRRRC
jgi:NAD(P)H dehydrogenase (quinone)